MKIDQNIINQMILNNLNEFLEDINKIHKLDDKYLIKIELNDHTETHINFIKSNFKIEYQEIFNNKSLDIIDNLFNQNNILLIDDISLSNIWKQVNNDKDKNIIIQYINVFYSLIKIDETSKSGYYDGTGKENFLNDFLKIFDNNNNKTTDDIIKNTLYNVPDVNTTEMKDLCKNLEEQIENNKDNSIFKLAQEMSSEIMTENLDLNELLNGNSNNLMNVISNIGNKLQEKFESNDINQEDLINDMNTFINNNDGIFKNVMDNFNNEINNEKMIKKKEKKEKKIKNKNKKKKLNK